MTDKKDLPAFPHQKEDGSPYWGMTIRDYFAAQALAGDFAAQNKDIGEVFNDISDDWMLKRAQTLYRMADAMLAARDK